MQNLCRHFSTLASLPHTFLRS